MLWNQTTPDKASALCLAAQFGKPRKPTIDASLFARNHPIVGSSPTNRAFPEMIEGEPISVLSARRAPLCDAHHIAARDGDLLWRQRTAQLSLSASMEKRQMKYTAIGILAGTVVGSLIMVIFEGDALFALTGAALVAAVGVASDMVIARRRTAESQVHIAGSERNA